MEIYLICIIFLNMNETCLVNSAEKEKLLKPSRSQRGLNICVSTVKYTC